MKPAKRISLSLLPTHVWDLIRPEWPMTKLRFRNQRYKGLCLHDPELAFETYYVEAVTA